MKTKPIALQKIKTSEHQADALVAKSSNPAKNIVAVIQSANGLQGKQLDSQPFAESGVKPQSKDDEFLPVLMDYAKLLYKEEMERAERYHQAMKTYLIFISFTFSGTVAVAKWLDVHPAFLAAKAATLSANCFAALLLCALGFLLASLVLTILVIKGWKTEGLCSPHSFALAVSESEDVIVLRRKIIANYVVAADRYIIVNDSKGKLLSSASMLYCAGLCFLLLAMVFFIFA